MIPDISVTEVKMKCHLHHSIWNGLYITTLLGGEFDNCHGQGKTPEGAVASLKLVVNLRRRNLAKSLQKG